LRYIVPVIPYIIICVLICRLASKANKSGRKAELRKHIKRRGTPKGKLYNARVHTVRQHVKRLKHRNQRATWRDAEIFLALPCVAGMVTVILARMFPETVARLMMPIPQLVLSVMFASLLVLAVIEPFIRRSRR
jgi:hypothetical protein